MSEHGMDDLEFLRLGALHLNRTSDDVSFPEAVDRVRLRLIKLEDAVRAVRDGGTLASSRSQLGKLYALVPEVKP